MNVSQESNVESLLGFADRLLVALWPASDVLSVNQVLIPLRAYIEHILRVSRATYYTLLTAFYYLVLFRSLISSQKSTTNPSEDSKKTGPLQCQRRMFLSALILASKYTQERSFSSRVWAKISGLCIKEINTNEAVFLSTIDWRLYISNRAFESWVAEVLCYAKLPELALPESLLTCSEKDTPPDYADICLQLRPCHLGTCCHKTATIMSHC